MNNENGHSNEWPFFYEHLIARWNVRCRTGYWKVIFVESKFRK